MLDGDAEVAYDTAMLGALRPGYRCFQLRHPRTGTRIELCSVLVHISLGEVPHLWAEADEMRRQLSALDDGALLLVGDIAEIHGLPEDFPLRAPVHFAWGGAGWALNLPR